MARPCACECPDACRLCWLWHHDARYRRRWGDAAPTTPAVPTPRRTLPCLHLGGEKGRRLCAGCRGHVELKVYHCAHPAHGETTLGYCRGCVDYTAG